MTDTWEASFGDLDFSPAAQYGEVTVKVHGLKRGKHVRVTAVADSLIQDGSIERVVRDDNREVQLVLCLDGTDSEALAQYEADLFREVNRGRNEFRWTPPDGFGATAVFDVLWADLAFADDDTVWDLDEIRGRRNYVLTLRCLPFARSVEPFTVSGVTSGATPTTLVIDEATSTTGWFGEPDGGGTRYTPGQSGSEVFVDALNGYYAPNPSLVYAPATPVDMTGTQYVDILWRAADGATPTHNPASVKATADGLSLSSVAVVYEAGGYRNTFVCPDSSVSEFVFTPPYFSGSGTFRIDQIRRTNQAPSTGTLRQKMTTIEVPGSARTPASLSVQHESSALGQVLVYTSPELGAGYAPALSPYAVDTGTAVAGNVSGRERSTFGSGASFDVPTALLPAGSYQLVARMKRTGATSSDLTVTSTASLRFGATEVVGSSVAESLYLASTLTSYSFWNLGSFSLPTATVPVGSSATVRVNIADTSGCVVDEAWLFHMPGDSSAHLSQVDCGTGTPAAGGSSNRLWLDAATTDRPYPTALVGTQADRSDARGVVGEVWDEHLLPAGTNLVFVVTSNALDALVQIDGHARWHTHPAA